MISIKNLNIKFNNETILEDINFTLDNEIIVIVGKSGCGKTTLLKTLSNFILADSGILELDDEIFDLSKENFKLKSFFGYMFQNDLLFKNLNLYQNATLGLKISHKINPSIDEILKKFGIFKDKDKYPEILSGGERQRVALARTFLLKKDYYLFDEPFSRLDYITKYNILEWFKGILSEIKGAIFITHDIEEAIKLADSIFILKNKRIYEKIDIKNNKIKNLKEYILKRLNEGEYETNSFNI